MESALEATSSQIAKITKPTTSSLTNLTSLISRRGAPQPGKRTRTSTNNGSLGTGTRSGALPPAEGSVNSVNSVGEVGGKLVVVDGGAAAAANVDGAQGIAGAPQSPDASTAWPSNLPRAAKLSTTRSTRAWVKGIQIFNDSLTKDKRKRILVVVGGSTNATSLSTSTSGNVGTAAAESLTPLALLLKDTRTAALQCAQRKSGVQKKFEQIIWTLDRFAQSIDVLIQQNPDTTAIAWGAIRMLVTVAVSDQATSERLGTALNDVVDIIARCEDFQSVYPDAERLESITSRLYAEVINFLVRAKKFYATNGAKRLAKNTVSPFEVKFGAILQRIEKLRQEVRDEVQLLVASDQVTSLDDTAKIQRDLIAHIGRVQHKWLIDEQNQQVSSSRKREKDLRSIRYWLDATHFDHLRREKHWQDGTCEWILSDSTFDEWLSGGPGPFWIYGIPGSGKTVMSTFLWNRLQQTGRPVIQFFCKHDELSKRRPSFVVATILSQLLDHQQLARYQDGMAALIMKEFNKHKDISKMSIDALCALLESVLALIPPIVLIVDALDECDAEGTSRDYMVGRMIHLSKTIPSMRLIFTSRHEDPFPDIFQETSRLEMSKDNVSPDIKAVITSTIASIPKLHSLKDRVISALVAGADGMFLWAELMLATLKKARNRNAVERMLANLPVGLRKIYEHILVSIGRKLSEEDLQFRRDIFSWVTTAIRPMTVAELSIALAIKNGSNALDDGEIIMKLENDIREVCGPMLTISGDHTVQVVHMSVTDMLHCLDSEISGPQTPLSGDEKYFVKFKSEVEHARLASACVTYLAYDEFHDPDLLHRALRSGDESGDELKKITDEHFMLEYATQHWIDHVCSSLSSGKRFIQQILAFLQSKNTYIWIQLMTMFNKRSNSNFSIHILQRSRLMDWVKGVGLLEDTACKEALDGYLVQSFESGVQQLRDSLGEDHVQTLTCLHRLGCLYDHEDRITEAQAIHEKIINAGKGSSDGEKKTLVIDSCIELAYLHRTKAEYGRSIELLEIALGGKDPDQWGNTASDAEAMADLGVVYRMKGDLEKAREFGERGAEGLTVTLGPTVLMTIRYVIQLCRTYFESGMYEQARRVLEDVLRTADEVLGPTESATLHGRDLLGNILHKTGELDAAEKLLREVLELMRQQWGETGRSTALLKGHVADVLVDKEEFEESVDLYRQAADTYSTLLGDTHPDTRELLDKIAECRRSMGMGMGMASSEAAAEVVVEEVEALTPFVTRNGKEKELELGTVIVEEDDEDEDEDEDRIDAAAAAAAASIAPSKPVVTVQHSEEKKTPMSVSVSAAAAGVATESKSSADGLTSSWIEVLSNDKSLDVKSLPPPMPHMEDNKTRPAVTIGVEEVPASPGSEEPAPLMVAI